MDNNVVGDSGTKKTSMGLDENLEALLCYLWLLGLVFFILEKDSKFVRFHGLQATLLWVAVTVLYWVLAMIPFLGWFAWIISFAGFVLAIIALLKAYKGERYKIPVIGDIAEKQVYGA